MSNALIFAGIIVFGYLLGSVPFGLLFAKLCGVDIRKYGSGKTGATNVLRTLGLKVAIPAFICDITKGAIPVLIAIYCTPLGVGGQVAAALAAVVGHNWPIYTKFQGGRGVATSLGGLAAMSWPVSLLAPMCLAVFAAIVILSHYASLGSMLASLSVLIAMIPLAVLGHIELIYLVYGVVGTGLIIFQHRDNIARLVSGTERKLGERGGQRE
jgi:glycerol-3-phosphate acyltransferase PlsY